MSNPVLIVGAGPVGLSAAFALAQSGVPIRIIDKLQEPTNQSRAAIVHARTLEHFERLGIVDDFLTEGVKVHGVSIHGTGGKLLVHPTFDHIPSPYPFMIGLEQFKTEEILARHLKTLGVEVERNTELLSFADKGASVTAAIKNPDGSESATDFSYIVGTDGARSTVRAGLGFHLEGETLDAVWITVDVKIRWDRSQDEAIAYLSDEGIAFIAPMNDDRWRVIINLPGLTHEQAEKLTVQDVQDVIFKRFGVELPFYDPVWISPFGINTRMAPAMQHGRAFLAGDAAHVHSPVGGQGMNTGIQDALNLAWKLALATKGTAAETVLDSYNAERHANAEKLLSRVGPATKMSMIRSPITNTIRENIIRLVGILGITRFMPNFVSMLDVGYPNSPIVFETHETWLSRGPRAGERAPDAEGILGTNNPDPQNLFSLWAGDARHQLLIFGDSKSPESAFYTTKNILPSGSPSDGSFIDTEGLAHANYAASQGAMYLIRPDGIVAFRSSKFDTDALAEYLKKFYPGA